MKATASTTSWAMPPALSVPAAMPEAKARISMASTSSMTAAPRMTRPLVVPSAFRSPSTRR